MTIIGLRMNKILDYIDSLYPNAKCELKYSFDYEFLIAIMMSAQSSDVMVNRVNSILFSKYDSLDKLYNASLDDISLIIRDIGTYNKKSVYIKGIVTRLVNDGYSVVPNDRKYLESLPGIGRKSANLFLSNVYGEPFMAVDTHIIRICKRIGLCSDNSSVIEIERILTENIDDKFISKVHHQLVMFGRYYCKAFKPQCIDCKLKDCCNYYNKNH